MRYFNWLLGHKCDSCPRSSTCPDHEKEVCPGPAAAASFTSSAPPRPHKLGLETLESREVFSVNPIVAENQLPGNSPAEWDISGTSDSTIQGFSTDISVDHGQTVSFKVNDPASAPYHIDIYRLGYYGGLGARKVASIPSSQTIRTVQPAPLTDSSTGLVDAGNWSVSATWAVPANAVSGLYIGKLVREDTGGASHIVFVVRDDEGGSDLLYQTSDTTWQAYNNWGGKSTYDPSSNGNFRAYAVSYNRPLITRDTPGGLGQANSPFWSEVAMIRWVEANGYNVSYTTGVDTDRRGSELLEHKVFMSVGHDEYWSAGQRANVEAAEAAGVNLAFFSGNEIYWKIRWQNSIDSSGTPYRTLVCYKESTVQQAALPTLPSGVTGPAYASGVLDPSPIWTGLWRDLRFANDAKVEQLLTGQLSSVNRGAGGQFGTAIQVPAAYSQMRLWRNTSIASLQAGQVATLANGTLGYEWDEASDSGFQPAGLFALSSTTESVPEKMVDPVSWPGCGGLPSALCSTCRGCLVAQGTATHTLTEYRAPSGALVFAAGTIQWSWGLDGTHDGGATVPDVRMQQATVNLFADMGVSAGSLQAGLVQTTRSTDLVRPTSTITSPAANTTAHAGVPVTITGTASDSGGGVVAGIQVSTDGGQSWHPATGWANWSYTWTPSTTGPTTILTRAVDDNGNLEIPGAGVKVSVAAVATSTTGLVAAYNFNAGSGSSVADSSGSNNNGTISNATWSATGGRFGNAALSFNGTNSWVTVPDSNSLDLTTGMTLEAWVKPSSVGNWASVLMKESSSGLAYSLYASDTASHASAYLHNTGDVSAVGGTATPANAWTHLAATYDGANLVLYVNGTQVSSTATTAGIVATSGALRIGGDSIWGEYFSGLIDDVRVYNRALNQGEILTDMSTAVGGTIDTTAPTVAVTTPSGTVGGTTTLTATASDNVAIAGVQFLLNGQPLGAEVTSAPYTLAWNTATYSGSYTITARARDVVGNTTTSAPVTLTASNPADTTPPTIALTGQTANTVVSGKVVLRAVAGDNIAVAGVQFKANGVNIGAEVTVAPYAVVWDTAGLPSGTYTITAVGRDLAGNLTTSAAVPLVVDTTAPVVTQKAPAAGATSVATSVSPTVTFSESIQPSTLSFTLKDAGGNVLAAAVAYDDTTHTATLSPNASLATNTTYTLTVSGAKDLVGNAMAAPVSWTFTTANVITGASIWDASAVPAVKSAGNDTNPQELGVKFQTSLAGVITGLQFYKGAGNTGTHLAHLWSSTGTLLGTATFAGESASGWQSVNFATPIAVAANTTYVASYYAPNGGYSYDSAYFASSGVNSYPLRALSSGESGGNGVFFVGSGGGFPNQSYNGNNYWVDVVFSTSSQDTTPPAVVSQSPATGAADVATASTVTVTFAEPVQAATVGFVLRDAAGNSIPATVKYNDATWTATLTPTAALTNSAVYTATVSGAKDSAGNLMTAPFSWSFTTAAAPRDGSQTIWDATATPATASWNDTNAQEVGVKFRSTSAGYITGVQFYKGSGNTGTHVAHLWSSTGTLLATGTFTGESATGWQAVSFASPVAVAADTTYVASYYAPNGGYALSPGFFLSNSVTSGALTALASGTDGGNGVYFLGTGGGFPSNTYNGNNYWVDVTFSLSAQDTTPPAVASQSPAPGATGVAVGSAVTVTFAEPVQAGTVGFVLKDAAGNTVPASVTYNAATNTATLTPTSALAQNTTYTATVSGAADLSGNVMPSAVSWSFTTPTPVTSASLWTASTVPTNASWNDSNAQEVGVKFYSDIAGAITGLRFYKGSGNTGTHVGNLWTATGTLLATATFTNESATGWQTVTFSNPVLIAANTLYVASYYAPNGHYALDSAYFAARAVTSSPLHAPADGANGGNGLYRVGAGGGFPGSSYNSNNYWVDVLFDQTITDTTPPTVASTAPAAGATNVLPSASITITFSEAVAPESISFVLKDAFNNTVAGNLSYNATTHVATFVPGQPLLSFANYTMTISGVTDTTGNTMTSPVTRTFRTQGVWTQTTVTDFNSGTNDGTVVTNVAGGEVQLAPLLQEDFGGTSLNGTNWTTVSYAGQGGGSLTRSVAGGILTVGGNAVFSVAGYVNTAVEASLSFGAAPWQHFGLATSFDSVVGNYWAMFSTLGSTNHLYARVNANGTTADVDLGALPAGFHNYRVQPTTGGFDFYVDNVLQTSIAASFQTSVAMKAGLSDFTGTAGQLLQVDSVWFKSYDTTRNGTFTSTVFDATQHVTWGTANWTAVLPTGTSLTVQVRTGDAATPDSTWTDWITVSVGMAMLDSNNNPLQGRFFEYRAVMATTSATATPRLDDITFTWS